MFLLENTPHLMSCFLFIQCFSFQILPSRYSSLSSRINAWVWKYCETYTSNFFSCLIFHKLAAINHLGGCKRWREAEYTECNIYILKYFEICVIYPATNLILRTFPVVFNSYSGNFVLLSSNVSNKFHGFPASNVNLHRYESLNSETSVSGCILLERATKLK